MNKYVSLLLKIRIHPICWPIAGVALLTGYFWELLILFAIVFIHEMGHAVMARRYHWKIKKVGILPFGGVCEVEEHGNRPLMEELHIIAAGPLQHVWMGAAVFLLHSLGWMQKETSLVFHQFNAMIFLFNLLPVWPLDGGKLLSLAIASKAPFLTSLRRTLRLSASILFLLLLFVLIANPANLQIWIVFGYLLLSHWAEWKQIRYTFIKFLLERYYGNSSAIRRLEVIEADANELVLHTMERFRRDCKHTVQVQTEGNGVNMLDENEMLHTYFAEKRPSAKLKDLSGMH